MTVEPSVVQIAKSRSGGVLAMDIHFLASGIVYGLGNVLRNHRAIFGLFAALVRDSVSLSLYGRTVQLSSWRIVSEAIVDDCSSRLLSDEVSIVEHTVCYLFL